jgi:hypothetical protein
MGALENLLPEKIKSASLLRFDNDDFVLPYFDALAAIEIANEHKIAILGVDAHEIRDGSVFTVDMADASAEIEFTGDWHAYVQQLNDAARSWLTENRLSDNHGYILTSTSKEEFEKLKNIK